LSKLGFEFALFCHPELVSGSQMTLFYEMLNQVQHDTGKRNLFLKKQINIKNSNKISSTFEKVRPIWTAVIEYVYFEVISQLVREYILLNLLPFAKRLIFQKEISIYPCLCLKPLTFIL
jgi:hypothetical protein